MGKMILMRLGLTGEGRTSMAAMTVERFTVMAHYGDEGAQYITDMLKMAKTKAVDRGLTSL